MFSKPLQPAFAHKKEEKNIMKPKVTNYTLTYETYYKNNVNLKKYKLPDLKVIVKEYNLPRTGKKEILLERIQGLFLKMKTSEKIQKLFRGWLVRRSFKLRGDGWKKRNLCVNDSDFVTLEPLNEIPYELFYSYKDEKDFMYGFSLISLMQLIKNKTPLKNPYNRENFPPNSVRDIISLNNITKIIYRDLVDEVEFYQMNNLVRKKQTTRTLTESHRHSNENLIFSREYYQPTIIPGTYNINEMNNKYNFIIESRTKNIQVRIQSLFMEIDQLGNYSQSSWFSNLDRIGCLRFYRCLCDLWNYRAQLSYEMKKKICPFLEPFANIFSRSVLYNDAPLEDFQILCVTVMENLIYAGLDDEYRKIAAFHLLSALTIVSAPARSSLPWLYESIAY
uniref:SAP domain-containing protein n=1 Tax=viral metagenome TaxID=1070528 RepID=A0A6C0B7J7_9ZZZZ